MEQHEIKSELEEVNAYVRLVKEDLMTILQLNNLMNLELFSLRKIAEEVVSRNRGKLDYQIEKEIFSIFVQENYGINPSDLEGETVVFKSGTSEVLGRFKTDSETEEFEKELDAKGVNYTEKPGITESMIEYIKRERERNSNFTL